MNIPADALVETVERYNELAHAGKDADFSKVSTRLFPRGEPAVLCGAVRRLGHVGADWRHRLRRRLPRARAEKNPVPGLFVAGNTMGGRFLVDYPVTVAGASHSMAMSFVACRSQGGRRQVARSPAARIARAAGCRAALPPGTLARLRCARPPVPYRPRPLASLPERPWSCTALLRQRCVKLCNRPKSTEDLPESAKIYQSAHNETGGGLMAVFESRMRQQPFFFSPIFCSVLVAVACGGLACLRSALLKFNKQNHHGQKVPPFSSF